MLAALVSVSPCVPSSVDSEALFSVSSISPDSYSLSTSSSAGFPELWGEEFNGNTQYVNHPGHTEEKEGAAEQGRAMGHSLEALAHGSTGVMEAKPA